MASLLFADPFADLNTAQRAAIEQGLTDIRAGRSPGPLLVIAGAGAGKTRTLTARVARLILEGADPRRILLLTFTRRAAREMARRATALVDRATQGDSAAAHGLTWAGTFHAVGQRLLRAHAPEIGLGPDFTILDRSDGEDLMGLVREERRAEIRSGHRPALPAVNRRRKMTPDLQVMNLTDRVSRLPVHEAGQRSSAGP